MKSSQVLGTLIILIILVALGTLAYLGYKIVKMPEGDLPLNETYTCASIGEQFSAIYTNEYPMACCEGLTSWESGFDTRISIGTECYQTGMASGYTVGTCINCGDGICDNMESVCNCPTDCKNNENSDYASIGEFCDTGHDYYCSEGDRNEEICSLCESEDSNLANETNTEQNNTQGGDLLVVIPCDEGEPCTFNSDSDTLAIDGESILAISDWRMVPGELLFSLNGIEFDHRIEYIGTSMAFYTDTKQYIIKLTDYNHGLSNIDKEDEFYNATITYSVFNLTHCSEGEECTFNSYSDIIMFADGSLLTISDWMNSVHDDGEIYFKFAGYTLNRIYEGQSIAQDIYDIKYIINLTDYNYRVSSKDYEEDEFYNATITYTRELI